MKRLAVFVAALLVCTALAQQEEPYAGPRPPKPDIPYLMHADNLIETEVTEAKEEQRKDEATYTIAGAASSARTPLAEPIFLLSSEKIAPDSLELYKMEVKGGNRQITLSQKKRRGGPRAYRLSVTRLADRLYRIEVDEGLGLENGEYALTPGGSNQVFCFAVY